MRKARPLRRRSSTGRAAKPGTTARKHDGRGPYCHMGVCYECLMEIDGVPNQQSCLIPVREGMSVKRQSGAPSFRTEENK